MTFSITIKELSVKLSLELKLSDNNPDLIINGCASLDKAGPNELSFLSNIKYNNLLSDTKAGVVILDSQQAISCPTNCLISNDPYLSFAKAVSLFAPDINIAEVGVHASSFIDKTAVIDKTACIGANVFIGDGVVVGSGVQVGANAVISSGARIGENSIIYPNVTIYNNVIIGSNVTVHAGSVIGSDGFGLAKDSADKASQGCAWVKIPQVGSVIIENNVEIGANTCIDRGALDNTHIGEGVKIDNLVQIAHNVSIGDYTAIAAKTGIAGSTIIGKNCLIGGASGINGHINICDNVMLAGMSMVTKSIDKPGFYASGLPARPQRDWHKQVARFNRLGILANRVRDLGKNLEKK